jgi:pyruvate carboxylase subunit B
MYQIPGGMLSNLISQLKQQNALDRYQDVLEEMPRVREDMGFPPLVTPTSQIVGIQAVMNVINGERYKIVSNEVKDYMKGFYGRSPAPVNKEIAKKIIGDEEPITCRPADLIEPEYEKFKKEGEELGIIKKEEDVLTLAMLPPVAKQFLKGELEEEEFPTKKYAADDGDHDLGAIPTEYSVEVDGDVFDVKIMPTGYLKIEEDKAGNIGPIPGALTASMQGMVLKIKVNTGDKVQKGTVVAVLEAMKMENDIYAEEEGIVEQIFVEEGDTVNAGDNLMLITPLDE